ncbi:stage II sporulation protein M [Chengkuizengella axinellae]|uniref:Stage II sporulation protein M n=1 Tax=Chengkuizengella axinellae TaxID=3064388 RepID=A0ABT9IW98_9BACL|nr:stage II sporulation protein M [Chengkuizengella sp. 2205SS18-9]MDP5273641.1 stage II sporulation protein M [Chengkuizengella sp. 2205SS18-9]
MNMQQYLKDHLSLYIFVSVLFIMGIIFGALMVNALSLEQKQDMSNYLDSFFKTMDEETDLSSRQLLQETFGLHLKWMLLIWVLGLSVIGLPFILILDFLKGVLIGFTTGYIVGELSWDGILFTLVSIAPQNLIIIPVIIIASVSGVSFSIYLIKNRLLQKRGNISKPFMTFSFLILSLIGVLFVISMYETYLTPVIMKWITPMLLSV